MKRQHGFTLIELVIAMTLTAMLLAMLSAGLYGVVSDWRRETSGLDTTLDKSLAVLQLDRALQAAFPHVYVDQERIATYIYFNGDEHSLSFVSTVSPQRTSGLTAWQLLSDEQDGLQLKLTPAFSDNPDARFEALDPVSLLPNYTAELHYLVQKDVDTKEWVDEWVGPDRQSLPIAVQMILTPIDEEVGDDVMEIVAPIRAWRNPDIQPIVRVD